MAHRKDIWLTVQQDYLMNDTISLKDLAQKHNVSYNTLRHKIGDWKKNKQIAREAQSIDTKLKKKPKSTQKKDTMPSEPIDLPSEYSYNIPETRDIMHMEMYDRMALVVLKYLNNPEFYLETLEGMPKGKLINDLSQTIKTIQVGQNEAQDRLREIEANNKETKLDKYTAAIEALRKQRVIKIEEDEKTTSQNQSGEHLEGEDI